MDCIEMDDVQLPAHFFNFRIRELEWVRTIDMIHIRSDSIRDFTPFHYQNKTKAAGKKNICQGLKQVSTVALHYNFLYLRGISKDISFFFIVYQKISRWQWLCFTFLALLLTLINWKCFFFAFCLLIFARLNFVYKNWVCL